MENNEEKKVKQHEGNRPVDKWIIDHKKCTVCGECVDACKRGLLVVKEKRIEITNQWDCNWCGDCSSACASDAIELT